MRRLAFVELVLVLAACVPPRLSPLDVGELRGGVIEFESADRDEAAAMMRAHCRGDFYEGDAKFVGSRAFETFNCAFGPPRVVRQNTISGVRYGVLRFQVNDRAAGSQVLLAHCGGEGVTEVKSIPDEKGRTEWVEFLCGDSPEIRRLAAGLRAPPEPKREPANIPNRESRRPESLPFGVIDVPERGRLEVGSSHRVAGSFWEFVVTYTNTTGAAFSLVTVECVTLAGRRALNAEQRSQHDGVPAGEVAIFKIPVEDVADPAELASCRVTRAQR